MQVDFKMPGRLGAEYVAEDNTRKAPVMLHRAIVGSLERFIGILIEHYAGAMPLWLAPVQAVVMNITEHQADYAAQVAASPAQAPASGPSPTCGTRKLPIKFGNIACKSCLTSSSSATRKWQRMRLPCVPAAARISAGCRSRPLSPALKAEEAPKGRAA